MCQKSNSVVSVIYIFFVIVAVVSSFTLNSTKTKLKLFDILWFQWQILNIMIIPF